jgi:hypothetical protein
MPPSFIPIPLCAIKTAKAIIDAMYETSLGGIKNESP